MSGTPKRKLSDALAAYQQEDLLRLDGLVEAIETMGPAYRFHATPLRSALKQKDQAEAAVAAYWPSSKSMRGRLRDRRGRSHARF